MDSAVAIEVTQAKADIMPVLRDVGRRAPHVPVHANIVQRVWAAQPAKEKTQNCQCEPESRQCEAKELCVTNLEAPSQKNPGELSGIRWVAGGCPVPQTREASFSYPQQEGPLSEIKQCGWLPLLLPPVSNYQFQIELAGIITLPWCL